MSEVDRGHLDARGLVNACFESLDAARALLDIDAAFCMHATVWARPPCTTLLWRTSSKQYDFCTSVAPR